MTYGSHPSLGTIIVALSCCLSARAIRLYEMFPSLCRLAKGMDRVNVSIRRIIILLLVLLRAMIRFIILVLDIYIVVRRLTYNLVPHMVTLVVLIILTLIMSLNLRLGCINFSKKPLFSNID